MKKDDYQYLIFLDIDGVLNSLPFHNWNGELPLEEDKIEMLNNLLGEVDAALVISSSWRKWKSLDLFKREFSEAGFDYSERIVNKTPALPRNIRSEEIKLYLKDRSYESYVAIDDRDLNNIDIDASPINLVQTDSQAGLTKDKCKESIRVLTQNNQK